MSKKYDYKNFDTREWVARRKKNNLFRVASIFLALAILIGGFVGVWSTGIIQKAIYNSQDLPDYVSYVDHTHSYTKTVVEPTCTEQGYTLYECKYCDMSYKQDYTATIDHDYQEVVLEQATTTSYGKAELVCSMCGDVKYEITLPLVGHTFTSEVVEPTCTEDGYTIHRSTDTDDMYIDEVIPATGHSMRLKDNYFYCETCGVMEYIEDCVEYGSIWRYSEYANGSWDESKTTDGYGRFYYDSVEYWYADSAGVLYLAGDQYGCSYLSFEHNDDWFDDIPNYTKIVYLDTAIRATASNLPSTTTEVTFLADFAGGLADGYCGMYFPDGVETVVLDGDYETLYIKGLGIKSLSLSGNINNLMQLTCPSLEEIELGEGIENIGYGAPVYYNGTLAEGDFNFGNVDVVVFPHSAKYIRMWIRTWTVEAYELHEQLDWGTYYDYSPERVLEYYEDDVTWQGYEGTFEEWMKRVFDCTTYEEYVERWNALVEQIEEWTTLRNDKPILVVQEGTETFALTYDYLAEMHKGYWTGNECPETYGLSDLVLFLPTTITGIEENIDSCENVTIYYAGDQTDLALIPTTNALLVKSVWKDYVICNTTYAGQ